MHRPVSAVSCVLAATAAVAGLTPAAVDQSRVESAMWTWVEQYYADYMAMSAAPTGPAMEKWLAHYAPYAFFEDPTLGQSGIGVERIRQPYVEAFTGPLGPVRWTILRRVTDGNWVAVEGWLDGTQRGKAVRTRFTTWLKISDGSIAHQIDYLDYTAMRRQVAGEPTRFATHRERPASQRGTRRDIGRALGTVEQFYRRYEELPALASSVALTKFFDLMTEDFTFEDPTSGLRYDSRAKRYAALKVALAAAEYGPIHWEIDHRITDGEWVAVEGSFRGVYRKRPFATRFSTWLQLRGEKIARQIDYVDYATFRKLTSPQGTP